MLSTPMSSPVMSTTLTVDFPAFLHSLHGGLTAPASSRPPETAFPVLPTPPAVVRPTPPPPASLVASQALPRVSPGSRATRTRPRPDVSAACRPTCRRRQEHQSAGEADRDRPASTVSRIAQVADFVRQVVRSSAVSPGPSKLT